MDIKKCSHCTKAKSVDEFWKRGTGYQPNCIECQKKINNERYHNSPGVKEKHIKHVMKNRAQRRESLKRWKDALKCCVCGESHNSCLDFHHNSPGEKLYTVGKMLYEGYGLKSIEKEVSKCSIVCKNCHAKVHDGMIVLTKEQQNSGVVAKNGLHLALNQAYM